MNQIRLMRLAALLTLISLTCPPTLEASSPNIILFVVDDLPSDMCNFLGQTTRPNPTPHLDRLATEGVVLSNLHSPSPICTPSRFSILSGRYPSRAKNFEFLKTTREYGQSFVSFNTYLTEQDTTLITALQSHGYFTGAVGKNHVFEVPGWKHLPYTADPTDEQVARKLERNAELLEQAYRQAGFDFAERLYYGNPDANGLRQLASHNQDWVTSGAIEFLQQCDEIPFFLYLATTLPHGPFEKERSWKADRRVTPTGWLPQAPKVQPNADAIQQRLTDQKEVRWNRGNLIWLDDAVGRVVEELKRQDRLDSTILVFLSDHGTKAKGSVYDSGTRTPAFVWRRGGFPVGAEIAEPLSLVDLTPTLLDLAEVRSLDTDFEKLDGRSFAPLLSGKQAAQERIMYFEVGFTRGVSNGKYKYIAVRHPDAIAGMSLEERKRRLEKNNRRLALHDRPVVTSDPKRPFSHLSPVPGGDDAERVSIGRYPAYYDADQLYDQLTDPQEQFNLAADPTYLPVLRKMQQLMSQAIEGLPGDFPVFADLATSKPSQSGGALDKP